MIGVLFGVVPGWLGTRSDLMGRARNWNRMGTEILQIRDELVLPRFSYIVIMASTALTTDGTVALAAHAELFDTTYCA